ncbi:MAG: LytR/AlgR family response regulator transcription factor, partial [Longimicrobiales bacterium]
IVDDEVLGRERVRSLLEQRKDIEMVGECADGIKALQMIEDQAPDLVFLDVEMPELDGLDMLEAIEPERCPQVVFVTAHDQYLQRAFEVHALDYLRKPFTDERFFDALEHACGRVRERLARETTYDAIRSLMSALRQESAQLRDRLVVQEKDRGMFHVVQSQDIDWIEAKNRGVLIHVGEKVYSARQTLAAVEAMLDPNVFLRIHRSFIVNRTRVVTVKPLWKGEYRVTLTSGRSLGTGRTYRAAVKSFLRRA